MRLSKENHTLERRTASADELRAFEVEVGAARAGGEAWCVSPFIRYPISGANLIGAFKKRGTRDTCRDRRLDPASLSALHVEHVHLLEEHGKDRAALRQREAELANARPHEVNARATADALLELGCGGPSDEDRAHRCAH